MRRTVQQCLALRPDRFGVRYAHVPSFKKHQRKIDEGWLPNGAARHSQAEAIAQALTEAGYCRIGLDHYALPADSMVRARSEGSLHRNFQGYPADPSDILIGFGASAIGRLARSYVQNEVALGRYAARISKGSSPHEGLCPYARRSPPGRSERIMCDFSVDIGQVCRAHGARPDVLRTRSRLQILEGDGVIGFDGTVPEGAHAEEAPFLVRSVASAFDAHLGASGRTHSRGLVHRASDARRRAGCSAAPAHRAGPLASPDMRAYMDLSGSGLEGRMTDATAAPHGRHGRERRRAPDRCDDGHRPCRARSEGRI